MELLATRQKRFFYEANVGAGLPVVSTLRDLVASGDQIVKVEGIVSGTLSYLFNTFDGTVPFSALVREAQCKGLTEPDPREDLSGEDVARKLLILARQSGLKMDLQDVHVESLVPAELKDGLFSPRSSRRSRNMTPKSRGGSKRRGRAEPCFDTSPRLRTERRAPACRRSREITRSRP